MLTTVIARLSYNSDPVGWDLDLLLEDVAFLDDHSLDFTVLPIFYFRYPGFAQVCFPEIAFGCFHSHAGRDLLGLRSVVLVHSISLPGPMRLLLLDWSPEIASSTIKKHFLCLVHIWAVFTSKRL